MPKERVLRRIDVLPALSVGSVTAPASTTADPAPPAFTGILPPSGVSLTTAIYHSAATPAAILGVTWTPPEGYDILTYMLQYSTTSDFSADYASQPADQPSASVYPVKAATTYYVRVATVYRGLQSDWSATASLLTASDTVPPGPVTSVAWSWGASGDLEITWVDPASENLKAVEVGIWASASKTTFYRSLTAAPGAQRVTYTAAMNAADTANAYDPAVYIEVKALSWGGVYSTVATPTTQPTKAVPSTPTGLTTSWATGADTAGADLLITWTQGTDVVGYRLTIDGVARDLIGSRYTYSYETNAAEHSSTPDPVLSLSLVGLDGLRQPSSAATLTATNAAPPTTSGSLVGGFSTIGISITGSTALDFDHYVVRVILGGVTLSSFTTGSTTTIYSVSASGSYQVGITVVDQFGQSSTETVSSAVVIDTLTIAQLRAESMYSDSIATDYTSAPNNTVLKDDTTGAGVTYAASASAYRWTQVEYPLTERFRRVSIKLGSGSANFYVAVSSDASTWRWFAGVGANGYSLTERASEAVAQANVSLISALTNGWAELPTTIEARYIRVYHRNTSTTYRLDEFYGYTLVVADQIKAGDIQAIHIAAGTITADKLSVAQLSAITADMGSITAGTITGGTVQTATSGARVVLSSATNGGLVGYSSSDTYNPSTGSGTYQILWSRADGKLYAGGGTVRIDSTGIAIGSPVVGAETLANMITWMDGSNQVANVYGYTDGGSPPSYYAHVRGKKNAANTLGGSVYLTGEGASGASAILAVVGTSGATPSSIQLSSAQAIVSTGLRVGTGSDVTTAGYARIGSRLMVGGSQTSRYFYDDGSYTRYTIGVNVVGNGFVSDSDIYCSALQATLGQGWLGSLFNQAVQTTSNVGFNICTATGYFQVNTSSIPTIYINCTTGSNKTARLQFQQNGSATWGLVVDSAQNNNNDIVLYDYIAAQIRFQIGPGGNANLQQKLYIGAVNTTPSYQIHLSTDSAGKPSGGSWTNSTSDARAKTVLAEYEYGLAEVRKLHLVRYEYNGLAETPKGMQAVGFVAQEAMQVIPEMVSTRLGLLHPEDTEETELYTLNNDPAIYATMRAVQQLADLVEQLQARVDTLERGG